MCIGAISDFSDVPNSFKAATVSGPTSVGTILVEIHPRFGRVRAKVGTVHDVAARRDAANIALAGPIRRTAAHAIIVMSADGCNGILQTAREVPHPSVGTPAVGPVHERSQASLLDISRSEQVR